MLKKTITALSLLCILAACQSDDNSSPQPKPRKDIAFLLMDAMYSEPNEETKAAIEEVRAGKDLKTIDTSSFENFLKSCSE